VSVVAVYTSKGGSGKSTSAVQLAWTAAVGGSRTLLWDLDAQGASSYFLKHDDGLDRSARKLITGKKDWADEVRPTAIGGLSLIPCDQSLRHWDSLLQEQSHGKKLLSDWLKPLKDQFDVILLDCPPGLTTLSEAVFRAADLLAVPVVPSALGFRSWEQLKEFVGALDRKGPHLAPFLSMVDRRKVAHRELATSPPEDFLRTVVPLWSDIERTLDQSSARMWSRTARVVEVYRSLWEEIQSAVPN